ncbi:MAG: histidinol dehydrogenase [Lysobacterales bacterium]|jgi:histidinol dehydrogenase
MSILDWSSMDAKDRAATLCRPSSDSSEIEQTVKDIIRDVRLRGDDALRDYSKQFDGIEINELRLSGELIGNAASACESGLLDAMDSAIGRIKKFHQAGMPQSVRIETAPGLVCESRYIPISPVGLYIPGGTAPLISTVLMLGIPAGLAGCHELVLCTPPSREGKIDAAVLAAAARCNIKNIFMVGGAQAIAAMAFGTKSIPKCAKIYGPGNAWVTEAKRQVASTPQGAAQDLPAGPSEVMLIADQSADPVALCWDLLSQAEHGPDSQAILISDSNEVLSEVQSKIHEMAAQLPRAEILSKSLRSLRLIKVTQLIEAIEISNGYAPEHLIINCIGAETLADKVINAGSVFLGAWTPESLGDYCSGTNHVLPTYGYARAYSGLSVVDFMRRMTLQSADSQGLKIAGPDAARLAQAEGLEAHRMAVEYRLQSMEAP